MALRWKGEQISLGMLRAQREAVDATMAECVIDAKTTHPWNNRTGTAEGSIQIAEPARDIPGGVRGVWGSLRVRYFRWLEEGTRYMEPMPTLQPAADRNYPTLGARIRRLLG
jgi:hypothetical protein